jgi:hypothetical protein
VGEHASSNICATLLGTYVDSWSNVFLLIWFLGSP